jgi:hypothetical protein
MAAFGGKAMTNNIFVIHDTYDRKYASDGNSRLGAYLAQYMHRFESSGGALTLLRDEFAAAAFGVATAPIMSPPYVGTHQRVLLASAQWDENRRCGLVIDLATPTPASLADQLPSRTRRWQRHAPTARFCPPEDNDELAAYSHLTVRVPFAVELLPDPAYTDAGVPDVLTAKRSLRALTAHANTVLIHLITHLDSGNASTPSRTALHRGWGHQ